MENRKPEGKAAAVVRRPKLLWWLLLACIVLAMIFFLLPGGNLSGPIGDDPWSTGGGQTFGQSAPGTQDVSAAVADETVPQGALIIDDPVRGEAQDPLARIAGARPASAPADTNAGTGRRLPAANAAAATAPAVAAASRRPASPARARTSPPPAQEVASTDLISTLLRIIKQDEAASTNHQSMDALIAHIQSENEKTHNETTSTLASLGDAQPASTQPSGRPSRAQQQLNSCPAPNTVDGIACRDRVCAAYAGKDPACPVR